MTQILDEAVRVLRLHCDARHDCPCSRCVALNVVLAHAEANASDAEKWRAVRTPNGNESGQRELAQFSKLLVKIRRERGALSAEVERLRAVVQDACEIIEQGDDPRVGSSGNDRGWSPDISMTEWRTLYATLNSARAVETTNATE